ncbi:TIGR03086 family metal-binding protein [Actinocorallia sp. A-T 12471]|uniref:TIGR03086 family metal-binding protein n=1 Tax=Actinocorallia sp. A-T 12471 TaxID=3089813 RepID=UPI0029CDDABC|nr:TIGR03086 family metal-binding protein [Actinocorallia sp. A-T 12471]MDX6743657.1 TIGR03086 family metal-binding protein [Actinocorallia sp. A-T 12471]
MNEDLLKALAETSAEAVRIAALVPQDRLSAATPCPDYDLRELVNHWIVWTSHALEHYGLRTTLPEALKTADFTADPTWREDYAATLDRALTAWSRPEAWQGDIASGMGPTPPADMAAMMLTELALHTWDVARTIGTDLHISDPTAALLLADVEKIAPMFREYGGFATPIPLPASSPLLARALAASGRNPNWTP